MILDKIDDSSQMYEFQRNKIFWEEKLFLTTTFGLKAYINDWNYVIDNKKTRVKIDCPIYKTVNLIFMPERSRYSADQQKDSLVNRFFAVDVH